MARKNSNPTAAAKIRKESILKTFLASYAKTPALCLILDAFLVFVMLTGIVQFVYMLVMGTYPYNAFLAGFATSCGMFCNAANFRIQIHPDNKSIYSQERLFLV
jgi:oligosaccharyltransferase complex subunit epsilon